MRWNDLNFILLSGHPRVTLEDLILAIVLQRRSRGSAKILVSTEASWADVDPKRWTAESYVAVPQLLLSSLMLTSSSSDALLTKKIERAGHGLLRFNEQEEEDVRDTVSVLVEDLEEKYENLGGKLVFYGEIQAIALQVFPDGDRCLDRLLEQSLLLFEQNLWSGDELVVLSTELENQDRSDEQWTGLVNRFAIHDM